MSAPATAETLIVPALTERNLEEAYRAINALIRAHNALVYNQFHKPSDVIKLDVVEHTPIVGICTRPEPHICIVNGPCNGLPATADNKRSFEHISALTDREILAAVRLFGLWGWRCRCVVPLKSIRGPVAVCAECSKPILEDNEDD